MNYIPYSSIRNKRIQIVHKCNYCFKCYKIMLALSLIFKINFQEQNTKRISKQNTFNYICCIICMRLSIKFLIARVTKTELSLTQNLNGL